ncbi:MFS transporter [Brucella gallinifaecis]|uniref:MFS transporter n=1 Tax=Brucella gallinifaecis TaxID=215590 RepID=A0A502BIR6_9HYPH|nr:MFS transporter [Brucella gallinifaecis]TPF74034.1 MFS transporter [Brucella gallinifaecis]
MSSIDNSSQIEPPVLQTSDPTIHDPKRRRSIFVTVCIALMAVIAAVAGLNVAQSHLALDLGASQSQVLWMINIYAISLAALLLPLGAVGDRWGRKLVLLIGLGIFGVANIALGLAPRLSANIGPKATIACGVLLGGAGLALMALLVSVDGGYVSVLPGMVAIGIGMGLAMAPSKEAITSSLPRAQQGVASALNDVTCELGTSLGVALLGAVFAASYSSAITPLLSGFPEDAAAAASQNIANAMVFVDQGLPYADALYRIAQEAFVQGWQQAMWAGVAVMAFLFLFVALRGPARPAPSNAVPTEA